MPLSVRFFKFRMDILKWLQFFEIQGKITRDFINLNIYKIYPIYTI